TPSRSASRSFPTRLSLADNGGWRSAFRKPRPALLSSRRKARRAGSAPLPGFHIIARTLNKPIGRFVREECFLMPLPKRSHGEHSPVSKIAKETHSSSARPRADRKVFNRRND